MEHNIETVIHGLELLIGDRSLCVEHRKFLVYLKIMLGGGEE
jgi:hypothetical protein